jgi:tetratricopeptide (TPR) repeat protein
MIKFSSAIILCVLIVSCAGTPVQNAVVPANQVRQAPAETPVAAQEPVSVPDADPENALDAVLRQLAEKVTARLPKNNRLAIVNLISPSIIFSDYALEELAMHIDEGNSVMVVDRNAVNMAIARNELDFQMSAEVDEETTASIGKFYGAQSILSGSLTDLGDVFRLRITVFEVETLRRELTAGLDVRKDSRVSALLAAQTPLERKSTDNPVTAWDFRKRGYEYMADKHDYKKAIADFSQAIRLKPTDPDAYYFRAVAYFEEKEYKKCFDDCVEALNLNPRYIAAINQRGLANLEMAQYEAALADFQKALPDYPDAAEIYNNISMVYIKQNKLNNALQAANQSIRTAKSPNLGNYQNRAYIYHLMGMKDKVLADLELSLLYFPEDSFAKMRLKAYKETGVWLN